MTMATQAHKVRVYVTNYDKAFYGWTCSCGVRSASRDILHPEYARDDWRESHMGLDPLVTFPLF